MPESRLPPIVAVILGAMGILAGLVLLVAFVVDLAVEWNQLRLVLYLVGVIAVAVAVLDRQVRTAPRLATLGSVPVVIATACELLWVVLAIGRDSPFSGAFGLAGFWIGIALWLTAAWFGAVALRIGAVWRPAAAILVVGSLAAITGIDRLGLTSSAAPTIFGPIALTGIALNGVAWMLLGAEVGARALHSRRAATPAGASA